MVSTDLLAIGCMVQTQLLWTAGRPNFPHIPRFYGQYGNRPAEKRDI
jgi:hypothetical protein